MGEIVTANDVAPPQCGACEAPLTTSTELNRRIDYAIDACDACLEIDERGDDCWCVYGWFINGDPRSFEPDEENRPDEIAAWRAACEAWDRGEYVHPAAEEHGPWVEPGTGRVTLGERPSATAIGHCAAPRVYGMGITYCDQHRPPAGTWKSWPMSKGDRIGQEAGR